MADKKKKKDEMEEELLEEEAALPPPPKAPPPKGLPIGSLDLGVMFTWKGDIYRKSMGGNRPIGTHLVKTPTTGDTWIRAEDIKFEPETLVEPY